MVIYICPGCAQSFIGKTDSCLSFRLKEHARREEQLLLKHLTNCAHVASPDQLPEIFRQSVKVNLKEHVFNALHGSVEVMDSDDNWSTLHANSLRLSYYIENLKPTINEGLERSMLYIKKNT